MADRKTRIDEILDNGMDRKNRRIYFGTLDTVDEDPNGFMWTSVEQVIRCMHILHGDNPKKPIELHMHSPGGDAHAMMRLVDEILASPCQIKFIGGGLIASAATWVMCVCDERYLHKGTSVMLHDGWEGSEGKFTDVQIDVEFSGKLQDKLNQIFADNSYMPKEWWADVLQRDIWISADEAVLLGIADRVIESKKRGNLRRSRVAIMSAGVDKKELNGLIKDIYRRIKRNKVTKIEISVPKEECDPDIIIDESIDNISNNGNQ